MKVRDMTSGDIEALTRMGKAFHHQTRFAAWEYDADRVSRALCQILAKGVPEQSHCAFVAVDDNLEICGLLIGQIEHQIFSGLQVAEALVYYVWPERRMSGAGFKLIHCYRRWAEQQGAFEVNVAITSGDQLDRTDHFLRRMGYEHTGGNYSLKTRSMWPPDWDFGATTSEKQ